jgi:hypothetical protein
MHTVAVAQDTSPELDADKTLAYFHANVEELAKSL